MILCAQPRNVDQPPNGMPGNHVRFDNGVVLTVHKDLKHVQCWERHTRFASENVASFCLHAVDVAHQMKHLRHRLDLFLMSVNLTKGHSVRKSIERLDDGLSKLRNVMENVLCAVVGWAVTTIRTPGYDAMDVTNVFYGGCFKSGCSCTTPYGSRRGDAPMDLSQRRRLYAITVEYVRILETLERILKIKPDFGRTSDFARSRDSAVRVVTTFKKKVYATMSRHTKWALVADLVTRRSIFYFLLGLAQERACAHGGTGRKRDREMYEADFA